ncbi:HNH endonuclease [Microbacterium protaetiae]|uniref:HNH endonuclease n=1 Tax=Microbacterium protaetiae TaxID=2509458 RepID=A0A4P6EAG8_9MICO|nr:HNH endonuclease signature motif containing protein [Microbacterium protaetiae]QAY59120.1 HNH endonuclease [Microbacterium protaetiae]
MSTTTSLSPALTELDEIVDDLRQSRERAAAAFASEMFFFERIAGVVDKREQERAAQHEGARTRSSQLGMREVFAEIGAALRLSEWQVARKVSIAWTLTNQFHETLCDASCGQISPEHANLIAEAGVVIEDDGVRREYEAVALDMAAEMTPGQLKSALSGLVVRLDPEGTERRVQEAMKRRKVSLRELEPGMVRFTADVPTAQGVGAYNRMRDLATEIFDDNAAEKAATADGPDSDDDEEPVYDERTHAQIMADVFCDLLLTSAAHGHGADEHTRDVLNAIAPTVHVTVPATALAGETVGGASVAGFGPIDDETAKHLAAMAPAWIRVFTDPCSGVPISVDRYRPSARQRLFLEVRDEQCRFPGCRRRARKCDIDHTRAHAEGGPTCLCNLEHLCERHHTLKHETDWLVDQLPGGILRWTAPTLRTHVTRPPGTVRFDPVALIDPDPHLKHQLRQALARDPAPF